MPRRQSTATKSADAGQVFLSGAAQENSKETLETLWFSCGLPEAERAAALEAISSGVKGFLEQAVKSQKEAVAKLEKEIPLRLEEIVRRIVDNRAKYEQRNATREKKELKYVQEKAFVEEL